MLPAESQDGNGQLLLVKIFAGAPSVRLPARAGREAAGQRRIEIHVGQSQAADEPLAARPVDQGALVGRADLPVVSVGSERTGGELLAIEDNRLGDRGA